MILWLDFKKKHAQTLDWINISKHDVLNWITVKILNILKYVSKTKNTLKESKACKNTSDFICLQPK